MSGIRLSLRQIAAIGIVTFSEIIREKILWSSFLFALLSVGLAYAVSQLSYVDNARIALDFGMTAISLIGGLMSVVLGAALIAREIHNRTLYLVLTKAIWRWQFVVGRYLGLLGVIILNTLLMFLVALIVVRVTGGSYGPGPLAKYFLLQISEFALLGAMACVFSALSTTTLAAIFSSGIWVIGHAMMDLRIIGERIEPAFLRPLLSFVSHVLPDLTRFDVKAQISHDLPLTWVYTEVTVLYAAAYAVFALVLACLIFSGRDL